MSGIKGERYIDDDGREVLTGGLKAAATNKEKYGNDFYANIGRKGGKNGHTGGFAADPALAKRAGAIGGKKSKRGPAKKKYTAPHIEDEEREEKKGWVWPFPRKRK